MEAYADQEQRRRAEAAGSGPRATEPARRRAEELGVDLASIGGDSLITVGMVEAAAAAATTAAIDLPDPLPGAAGLPRIALFGARLRRDAGHRHPAGRRERQGRGDRRRRRVALGGEVMGVPVVGGFERLVTLFGKDAFDAAIIAISTAVAARARLREALAASGIPLANAIDPTARITAGVTLGTGNIVCAFCHFGVGTVVGDNNFLSAYNSYDHHNRLGSDIATGPTCTTSGLVVLGDRVRLGTGIHVEPHVDTRRRRPGRIRLSDRRLGTGRPRRQTPHSHDHGRAAALATWISPIDDSCRWKGPADVGAVQSR